MKELILLTVLQFFNYSHASIIETKSMAKVFDHAHRQISFYGEANVLLVFDIDNTLLTAKQDLGSYAWSVWQREMIKTNGPYAITNIMSEFYTIENVLNTLASMRLTESFIAFEIKRLQKLGASVIALTSRGPQMRSATQRELKANRLYLNGLKSHVGFPGTYIPNLGKGRPVSFQNGIYMTAGQNKGLMLKDLLTRTNQKFQAIIFVDDLQKHVENVDDVFINEEVPMRAFRYGQMDERRERFAKGEKETVHEQWLKLNSVWKEIFK